MLNYALALNSVKKHFEKICPLRNILPVEKNKKSKTESTVICPLRLFFRSTDCFQGGFFTKITFPKGFWITRKTDGVLFRGSELFGCVSPPYENNGHLELI